MKSNKQQCKKSLLPLSEEFNTQSRIADELSDELTEESTIFQQSTQFFSDCSEFDSKQQIVIKQAEYNTNEQLFKQKQQDNNLQNSYESLKEYIQKYKPKNIILDSKLKPFIPEYIPAVNTIENGISIPRPDGKFDKYGIYDVREVFSNIKMKKDQIMKKNDIHKESNQNISYAQKHKNIHQQNSQGYEDKNENLTDLFKIIQSYKPKIINIEAPLKPFIPDYIPRVSFPDPMLKIPRPDGKEDYIGLKVFVFKFLKVRMMQNEGSLFVMQLIFKFILTRQIIFNNILKAIQR